MRLREKIIMIVLFIIFLIPIIILSLIVCLIRLIPGQNLITKGKEYEN